MAKQSRKSAVNQSEDGASIAETACPTLRQDADLWYRILVLLHDLSNFGSDLSAEKRLSSTTHELYISAPYFTESEAVKIRTTAIANITQAARMEDQRAKSFKARSSSIEMIPLEVAIHKRLADFFDKRKASGDSRPCGPHDMFPIYQSAFGIAKEELKDKRFLSRLRRTGLEDSKSQQGSAASR